MHFITGRKKRPIEDHFDRDMDLIERLKKQGKDDLVQTLEFENMDVRFFYVRQSAQRGLGHAVLQAEFFAREPFIVALGDCILRGSESPGLLTRLGQCFEEKSAAAVIAFHEVPIEHVSRYGIAAPVEADAELESFRLKSIVEKPSVEETPSRLAVCARYVFSPVIFDALRDVAASTPDDKEIQLTDAIQKLIEEGRPVYGVRLHGDEKRFDIGNFRSYFESFFEFALTDPEFGPAVCDFVAERLRTMKRTR